MSDSRVLTDHDVRKLRALLGADEDDAFRLGVTLLEASRPTPADYDALFDDDLFWSIVDTFDAGRWNILIGVIRSQAIVMRSFRTFAIHVIVSRGRPPSLDDRVEATPELADILASVPARRLDGFNHRDDGVSFDGKAGDLW